MIISKTDFESFFVVFDVITVNVVVRSDGFSEFGGSDHTRPLCGWATSEEHDASACATEARF